MPEIADIPSCMSSLARDRRGYPIPVTALVDAKGKPHFTITDNEARATMAKEDRCHLSGKKLLRGRWFIGGPRAAFHEHGAFLDGPMLDEASEFAMRTCPYIAAPNYSKRIEGQTLKADASQGIVVKVHEESIVERPALFVRLMCIGNRLVQSSGGDVLFVPKRPFRKVEFWMHGAKLDFKDGLKMAVESTSGEISESMIRKACGI